jgi:hypothetical protein
MQYNTDFNIQDNNGNTPLHIAANLYNKSLLHNYRDNTTYESYWFIFTCKIYGAKNYIRNNENKLASDYHEEIYKLLLNTIRRRIKKIIANEKIKAFLLRYVILHPKSKYIRRLVNKF